MGADGKPSYVHQQNAGQLRHMQHVATMTAPPTYTFLPLNSIGSYPVGLNKRRDQSLVPALN